MVSCALTHFSSCLEIATRDTGIRSELEIELGASGLAAVSGTVWNNLAKKWQYCLYSRQVQGFGSGWCSVDWTWATQPCLALIAAYRKVNGRRVFASVKPAYQSGKLPCWLLNLVNFFCLALEKPCVFATKLLQLEYFISFVPLKTRGQFWLWMTSTLGPAISSGYCVPIEGCWCTQVNVVLMCVCIYNMVCYIVQMCAAEVN